MEIGTGFGSGAARTKFLEVLLQQNQWLSSGKITKDSVAGFVFVVGNTSSKPQSLRKPGKRDTGPGGNLSLSEMSGRQNTSGHLKWLWKPTF